MSLMLDDPRTLDDTKLIELGRHTSEGEVAADGAIKSRDMKGGDGARQLTEDDKHFVPCPRDTGSVSRRILDCIEAIRSDDALPTSKT